MHDATRQQFSGSSSGNLRGNSDSDSWRPFYTLSAICANERDAFERHTSSSGSPLRSPPGRKHPVAPRLDIPQDSLDLLSQVACLCPPDASPHTPTHSTIPSPVQPCTPRVLSTTSSPMASPAPRTPSPRPAAYEAHIARGTASPKKPALIIDSLQNPRMKDSLPFLRKNQLLPPIELRRPSRFPKITLDAVAEATREVVDEEDIPPNSNAVEVLNARRRTLGEARAALASWQQFRVALSGGVAEPEPGTRAGSGSSRSSGIKRTRPDSEVEQDSRRVKAKVTPRPPLAAKVTENGSIPGKPMRSLSAGINEQGEFIFYTGHPDGGTKRRTKRMPLL